VFELRFHLRRLAWEERTKAELASFLQSLSNL
jgi:hypothetical protein